MASDKTTGQAIAAIIDVLDNVPVADVPRVMTCVRAYLNGEDGTPEPRVGRPRGSRNKTKKSAAQPQAPGTE